MKQTNPGAHEHEPWRARVVRALDELRGHDAAPYDAAPYDEQLDEHDERQLGSRDSAAKDAPATGPPP